MVLIKVREETGTLSPTAQWRRDANAVICSFELLGDAASDSTLHLRIVISPAPAYHPSPPLPLEYMDCCNHNKSAGVF